MEANFCIREKKNQYNLCIESNSFDAVNKGNTRDNEECLNITIHDRIQIGNRAFYVDNRLLRNKLISHNTKIKIYETLIRPVVVYGGET